MRGVRAGQDVLVDAAGRDILLSVRPQLLQDLLVRLFAARGWSAVLGGAELVATTGCRAAVVTDDVVIDLTAWEGLTVVLPGEGDSAGRVLRPGVGEEPFESGAGVLAALIDVLQADA
jgi:hypothetical protein